MKIFSGIFCMLLIALCTKAQWTPLTSGTTANLNDVDFLDANNGIVVGDSGKVLVTNNGGFSWTPLNFGTVNVTNVKMVSLDTIIVSYVDANNVPHQSFTHLGGAVWIPMFADSSCFRGLDTETDDNHKWISLGSSLISTNDHGQFWDTLFQFTCGAKNINRIHELNGVYNGGGLVAGFVTYSASMIRSEAPGNKFYQYDDFSFPNSDALTAFDFPYTDTGYIFMNKYQNFAPGIRNSLVKVYDFNLATPFPGDTVFSFTSSIIDTTIPAYINDCKMFLSEKGFAIGEDGNIYEANNSGSGWSQTYMNGFPLNKISFPDDQTGYAVGDNGTIVKYSSPTSISENTSEQISVYPNPASSFITIKGVYNEDYIITNINGKTILAGKTENGNIELDNIARGCYFINVNTGTKILRSRVVVININ